MAIFQAIFSLITNSLGTILSTVFGWAVVALFGETSRVKKIWLSGLVAAAAAWPILVIGIVVPRIATFVLALVPMSHVAPGWAVRGVWVALAIAVPLAIGLTTAARRPVTAPRQSRLARMARGVSVTIGLAAAFLVVFVTVPALRLVSFFRGRVDVHVPLVTDAESYEAVGEESARALTAHGFAVAREPAPWWMTAPSRILLLVDRPSFGAYVPRRFAYYKGDQLDVALYPNGVLLRGSAQDTAWAHGALVEALAAAPGLQTFDPAAQDIEKQIRRLWRVYRENPAAHRGSAVLGSRLREISEEIRCLPVEYDEWQTVYRQALQLGRALEGERQLLERTSDHLASEVPMDDQASPRAVIPTPSAQTERARARDLSIRDLVADITGKVSLLITKEVELARAEMKANLQAELWMLKTVAAGVVIGLSSLSALLVAVIFALAIKMPGWVAALAVGSVLLIVAATLGFIGWRRHVTAPLAMTRKTLREDAQWAKDVAA